MLDFIVNWTTDRRLEERTKMTDYVAYTTAQRQTADEAYSALPNSPIRPDRHRVPLRHRASVALRRLADRLEPAPASVPASTAPALADCR
jgi:hypothetical protein